MRIHVSLTPPCRGASLQARTEIQLYLMQEEMGETAPSLEKDHSFKGTWSVTY